MFQTLQSWTHLVRYGADTLKWSGFGKDIDICDGPDRLQTEISTITTEMAGGSPPAEIRNSRSPDRLQKEISVTSTEMAGGSPPAHIDICESPDRLQTVISVTSTEMAGGNPPADRDNCESPELI